MQSIPQVTPERVCAPEIAALLKRANSLFEEGYRAEMYGDHIVMVYRPVKGTEILLPYEINLRLRTCNCDSFCGPKPFRTRDGRKTCKHLAGIFTLACDSIGFYRGFYEQTMSGLLATADRYDRRAIHMGAMAARVFTGSLCELAQMADSARIAADGLGAMLDQYAVPNIERMAA